MPYSIAKGKGCSPTKPWAVVKDTDGTVVACHATRETALAQIRALYAAEPALAKARARVLKHPGHGDQKVHGGGRSKAVESYVRDSNRINSALRRGETTDEVAGIDAEMASSSLPAMTVHRAIEFSPTDKALLPWARLESKGDTVGDLGFTSTSTDKSAISDFTPMGHKDRFVMTIKVPAGTKGLQLGDKYGLSTGMGDQGEVLLDRGAKFRLTKEPRFTADGTTYLELEVVSTNQTVAKDAKAPPKDRISGSDVNEPGSASGKSGDVELSDATETAIRTKAEEHNRRMTEQNKPNWTRVTTGALRSVYRRGSGAFSVSHRPGIGRGQWAMARVNAFLVLASTGKPENPKYVGDNDLLHGDHPRHSKNVSKHLPHQHDQQTHATGGGASDAPKPERKKRSKADIAADDEKALALYESGKTWDQVAQEMGYANGGVARRSGLRHKEKRDTESTGETAKPTVAPAPAPTPPPAPAPAKPSVPEPTPVVNPRPMTDTDPSQGNVPTDDIDVAKATGRPYSRLKPETAHPDVREAEKTYHDAVLEQVAVRAKIDPYANAARDAEGERVRKVEERIKERAQKIRQDGEPDYRAESRARDELRAEGLDVRSARPDAEILEEAVKAGKIPKADYDEWQSAVARQNQRREEMRSALALDTADILFADGKGVRTTIKVTQMEYQSGTGYVEKIVDQPALLMPDGSAIVSSTTEFGGTLRKRIRREDGTWREVDGFSETQTERYEEWLVRRTKQMEQRSIGLTQDTDPSTRWINDTIDRESTLRFQQEIVDSPDTRIVIHAPVSAVGGIVTQGRFRSQHETGRTKGYKDPGFARESMEGAGLGVIVEDKTKSPIYAALHLGGVRAPEAVGAEQYGPVGFVLKREVHSRSTFTQVDSLGLAYESSPLTGKQTTPNGFSTAGGRARGMVKGADGRYRTMTPAEHSQRTQRVGQPKTHEYMEAQVLGGVSVADIDYVTIPKGTVLPAASRKKLEKAGIPIVEYDMADVAPTITGSTTLYPDKGKPYDVPTFADTPDWMPIPEPTTKWRGFVADIWKHLAGKHDQSVHAGARHSGYRLTKPDNPVASAGSQSPEAIASAKALRDRVAAVEPELTRTMIDLADKHGGTLEGLAFRLKSEQSLARKIDAEKGDFGGDTDKTGDAMSDVVRYTVTFKDGNYVSGATQTIADLQASGHKTRVKNYWKEGDPYQGVNVAVTTPDGLTFELQFHTPKSLAVKELNHKAYEKYRTATNARDRYRYWDEGVRIANRVPVPAGDILGFGDVRSQEFAIKAHTLDEIARSVIEYLERHKMTVG